MTDDYDPSTALTAYYVDRNERRPARLWATEKLLHDLRAAGIVDFFEGSGSNPTTMAGYASSKLWLRVASGITGMPGKIRAYDGVGDETLLASWPILEAASLAAFAGAFFLSQHTSDNITEGSTRLLMTATERTKVANAFVKNVDNSDAITEGAANLFMTTAERGIVAALNANMPAQTVKANLTGGAAPATNATTAQMLSLLGAFSGVTVQAFTATGTYTPTTGMKHCIVLATGGGGGGGGADGANPGSTSGGGGGAGGTTFDRFTAAQIGVSKAVTIGAAGTAGLDAGGNAGDGGDTILAGLATAPGGLGGTGRATGQGGSEGGLGGLSTGAALNIAGGDGGIGFGVNIGGSSGDGRGPTSGQGGASFWGGGAKGVWVAATGATQKAGVAGRAYGAGGSGAVCLNTATGAAGGVGAAGVMLILEFV